MNTPGSIAAEPAARVDRRGILAPATGLDRWLPVVLVVLLLTCSARYLDRHEWGPLAVAVLAGAALLGVAGLLGVTGLLRPGPTSGARWEMVRVVVMVALWATLTAVAPSFAWCAVPIAFAALKALPFGWAVGTVVGMTVLLSAAWQRISDGFDPVHVAGPVGIALATVLAYRALESESRARLEAQAAVGALAERTRLSRDIHDSVGQGLTSINLLLQAAEQSWDTHPDQSREHVRTAAATARDGLAEVRRVVRDLAPAELVRDNSGAALTAALERALAEASTASSGLDLRLHVHGEAAVPAEVAEAIVRTARGALANVREHSSASRADVTVTHHLDEVVIDVRDNGVGFNPDAVHPSGPRGRGLRGVRERAASLGGSADVESAPGEGTTLTARFPVPAGGRP